VGIVTIRKTGITDRAVRWQLVDDEGKNIKFFPSFRAARYWLEHGKTFKTKPVYEVINGRRGQKRIR